MHKRPVAVILLLTMLPQLSACTSWKVRAVAPAQAIEAARPREVRLRLRSDNSSWVIQDARIAGDSVYGTLKPDTDTERSRPVAFALADVKDVSVSGYSAVRSSILAAGVMGILVVAALLLRANHGLMGNLH